MEKIWNDKAREINMQMIVEIRKNLNGLRREIKENLNELRKEVKREVRGLKNRIDDLENNGSLFYICWEFYIYRQIQTDMKLPNVKKILPK